MALGPQKNEFTTLGVLLPHFYKRGAWATKSQAVFQIKDSKNQNDKPLPDWGFLFIFIYLFMTVCVCVYACGTCAHVEVRWQFVGNSFLSTMWLPGIELKL